MKNGICKAHKREQDENSSLLFKRILLLIMTVGALASGMIAALWNNTIAPSVVEGLKALIEVLK